MRKKPKKKIVFLRHDVDISPSMALKFGSIEKKMEIRSSFFFQIDAETYTIFSEEVMHIMRRLKKMGHTIGLHLNELMFDSKSFEKIADLITVFAALLPIDPVVSFHRPSKRVLQKSIKGAANAYERKFFDYENYVSDSARNMSWPKKLYTLLDAEHPKIQLLFHPVWWDGQSPKNIVKNLQKRRAGELNNYLEANFNKALGKYIPKASTRVRDRSI